MNHPRILAAFAGAYAGTMGGVIAWAWVDWFVHQWRPTHR